MLLCKEVDKAVHRPCTAFVYGTRRIGDNKLYKLAKNK